MPKEDFLSKFNLKDYNKELESIIDKKDFLGDIKNLLLSMLYKIEISYQDYETAKRDVINKKEYITKIIESIDKYCSTIKFIYPKTNSKGDITDTKNRYIVDKDKQKIETYPNEKNMLEAILKISQNEIIIDSKYDVIKKSFINFLSVSDIMNDVEVIRDFNGWSWYTLIKEIDNVWYNLIYQNLRILLGNKFLKEFIENNETLIDNIDNIKVLLEEKYGKELSSELFNDFIKIIVNIYIKSDKKEKEYIDEVKYDLEQKLEELEDTPKFLESLSKDKKKVLSDLNKIDKIINDKKLLKKEFVDRNEKLAESRKIFSISHLVEKLTNEREELILKNKEYSDMMNPQNILKHINNLKEKVDFINKLDLDNKVNIEKETINIQKNFIKCFKIDIEKQENKRDIIELIYKWRYYKLIMIKENVYIKDIAELTKTIEDIEKVLIKKAVKLKIFSSFSNDNVLNINIIRNIFNTKTIDLQNLEIQVNRISNGFEIEIYDGETMQETRKLEVEVHNQNNDEKAKKINIKKVKKIKLFY